MAADIRKSILTDSLSVPKTIGKGPMIIAPPPLTFPFPFMVVQSRRITATKAMANPVKTRMAPRLNNN